MATPRELVERLNDVINRHDPVAGRELFAPEARVVSATGRVLDLPGLARLLLGTVQAFPDMRVEVVRWVEGGDTVVTEEVMQGTHRGEFAGLTPTGQTIRLPVVHITRVVDDRIVERVTYHDSAGILRQLRRA